MAVGTHVHEHAYHFHFDGPRNAIKYQAALQALDILSKGIAVM